MFNTGRQSRKRMEGPSRSKHHQLVGNDFITSRKVSSRPSKKVLPSSNAKAAPTKLVTDIALPASARPTQLKPFSNQAPHQVAALQSKSNPVSESQDDSPSQYKAAKTRRRLLKGRFFGKK